MKEHLINFVEATYPLSQGQKDGLEDALVAMQIPAGEILIREGSVAQSFYFIVEGGFRSYLIKDGVDITDYFFFENTFASDYASLYSGLPSRFYLETIEESQVLQLKRSSLSQLGQEDPFFETLGRIMAERAFVEMEERTRLLHHENLETRFRWMMDKFPEVFLRVPNTTLLLIWG